MTPPSGTDIRLGRPQPADPPLAAGRVSLFGARPWRRASSGPRRSSSPACNEAARRRSGTAGFLTPLAGGVASFAGDGSPYNKVAGLGFGGAPDPDALSEIEQAFAVFGAPTQIELAHLADPEIAAGLTTRGYRLENFENVLGPGPHRRRRAGHHSRDRGPAERCG